MKKKPTKKSAPKPEPKPAKAEDRFSSEAIYKRIAEHCKKLNVADIDDIELTMLANSYGLYFQSYNFIKENGIKFVMITEKGGEYEQIRPEYTVMKNEYQNILKHSGKFGLTPGDRAKLFKDFGKKDDKDPLGDL